MGKSEYNSVDIGRAALKVALTTSRSEEDKVKQELLAVGIHGAGVDFGGEFGKSIAKIVERAVVAAQRENIVTTSHVGVGAVAGAAHEALEQVLVKAMGFNVGGKIGIARFGEHLCVALFMSVGVINLNEQCVGLAHRTIDLNE